MFAAYDFHSRGLCPFREISRDAIQRAIQQPHPRTKLVQQFGGGHAGNPGSHNNREVAGFTAGAGFVNISFAAFIMTPE